MTYWGTLGRSYIDFDPYRSVEVLDILERRAEEEATLIFRRHRENNGKFLYTDISNAISVEINEHYARLFPLFQAHPEWSDHPLFRKVFWAHLPALIRDNPKFRARVKGLPPKIKDAILAVTRSKA